MPYEADLLDHGENCSVISDRQKNIHSMILSNYVLNSIVSMTQYLLQHNCVVVPMSPMSQLYEANVVKKSSAKLDHADFAGKGLFSEVRWGTQAKTGQTVVLLYSRKGLVAGFCLRCKEF